MISAWLVAVTLSQYVRTTASADPEKCLWWNENTTITWVQSLLGNEETTGDTEFVAFDRAFATWQTQFEACGSLAFVQGARTTNRSIGYFKGDSNANVMVFRAKACSAVVPPNDSCWKDDDCGSRYDCWQFANTAIAMTTTSYDPATARILDADIELNAKSFIFTTVDAPVCVAPLYSQDCVATDVQNTVTHEIGHLLGLGHTSTVGSTMAARADSGEITKRTLDPGTKQFVCDVYPKGRPARSCAIVAVESTLGNRATGCSAVEPLSALALAGLVLVRRRRR